MRNHCTTGAGVWPGLYMLPALLPGLELFLFLSPSVQLLSHVRLFVIP